jgi:hypothetical protein
MYQHFVHNTMLQFLYITEDRHLFDMEKEVSFIWFG